MVGAEHASAKRAVREPGPARQGWWDVRRARLIAIVAGVLGVLSAVAVPLLPVNQEQSTLSWPQGGSTGSVEAPLVSYAPFTFDARIPVATAAGLGSGGALVATMPSGAPGAERYGLVAKTTAATESAPARLEVILRDRSLISTPLTELRGSECTINVSSTSERTTAAITGSGAADATKNVDGDVRPQMVGVFSDLDGSAPAGLQVSAELDTRFSNHADGDQDGRDDRGGARHAAGAGGAASTGPHRRPRARRFLPARWWRVGSLDVVVIGTLVLWHFIGATTADDGYQYTMARSAQSSGYMSNYFRYFGVPETPFGTPYYYIFGLLDDIWSASPWVRLPALLAGIVTWLVLSREVVPRLAWPLARAGSPCGRERWASSRCGCRTTTACVRNRSSRPVYC